MPTREGAEGPAVSVIIATYNRTELLRRLLGQLATQTFSMDGVEVVVVDDGSKEPVAPALASLVAEVPYDLRVLTQSNAGAAAARQRAVEASRGDVLVIVDDDMQVPPHFIAEHVALHRASAARRCVVGRVASDPAIDSMPLFERYHARMWDKLTEGVREGRLAVAGNSLATGNCSLRRADFLAVGGFNRSLERGEDAELGLKLERAGVELVFSEAAFTLHGSDHTALSTWLGRNFRYGVYEVRIARLHPWASHADPWRYLFTLPKAGLPFITLSVLTPAVARPVASALMGAAMGVDALGMERLALRGAGLVFGMEFFRGVRVEVGSLAAAGRGLVDFLARADEGPRPAAGVPKVARTLARRLRRAE